MKIKVNLAKEYIKHMNDKKMTWDDFFDKYKIPKKARTDFAVGCILKQAKEISDKNYEMWATLDKAKDIAYSLDDKQDIAILSKLRRKYLKLSKVGKKKLKLVVDDKTGLFFKFPNDKEKIKFFDLWDKYEVKK